MDTLAQLLGMAGLIEPPLKLGYAWINRDTFTDFEEVFFLTTASFEMAAEILSLCVGLSLITCVPQSASCGYYTRMTVKDPLHVLVTYRAITDPVEREYQDAYIQCSAFSLVFSVLPVLCWATFYPVWGGAFQGQDAVRLGLSVVSCVLVLLWLSCTLAVLVGRPWARDGSAVTDFLSNPSLQAPLWCGAQKAFEVYLLVSSARRLIAGSLGRALVVFQALKLLSVPFGYSRLLTSDLATPTEAPDPGLARSSSGIAKASVVVVPLDQSVTTTSEPSTSSRTIVFGLSDP